MPDRRHTANTLRAARRRRGPAESLGQRVGWWLRDLVVFSLAVAVAHAGLGRAGTALTVPQRRWAAALVGGLAVALLYVGIAVWRATQRREAASDARAG